MTLKYPKQPSSLKTKPAFLLTKQIEVTLVRSSEGGYVSGTWVDGIKEESQFLANVQPLRKGTELMSIPEADRTRELIKLYTTTECYPVVEGDAKLKADLIVYDNKTYEVLSVSSYKMGILDHYRVVAARLPISAGGLDE